MAVRSELVSIKRQLFTIDLIGERENDAYAE
jgi:hypothetical protein